MKLSPEYLAAKAAVPIEAEPTKVGLLERTLTHILNLPARAVAGATNSISGIAGQGKVIPDLPIEMQLPPATGLAEAAVDITGHLAPMLVNASGISKAMEAIPKFANLAKSSPVAATMAKDAAILGFLGGEQGALTAAEQAAEGAGYGALTALPRAQRVLPAAGIAALSKLALDELHPEKMQIMGMPVTQGDLNAIIGFGAALLPGQQRFRALPDRFALPERSAHTVEPDMQMVVRRPDINYDAPSSPLQATDAPIDATFYDIPNVPIITGREQPLAIMDAMGPQNIDDVLQRTIPAFDQVIPAKGASLYTQSLRPEFAGAIQEQMVLQDLQSSMARQDWSNMERIMRDPFIANILEAKGIPNQTEQFLENFRKELLRLEGERFAQANVTENIPSTVKGKTPITPLSIAIEKQDVGRAANETVREELKKARVPSKGKLQDIPEYLRTQGGAIDPSVMVALGRGAAGAGLGAIVDEDDPVRGAMIGASIGLSPEFVKFFFNAAQKLTPKNLGNKSGAITIFDPKASPQPYAGDAAKLFQSATLEHEGKVYEAATHMGAYNKLIKDYPDVSPESLKAGFRTKAGDIVSRREAADMLGQKKGLESEDILNFATNANMGQPTNIVDLAVVKTHDEFSKRISDKLDQKIQSIRATNLLKGESITSASSGRKYKFIKNTSTHNERPRMIIEDVFSGEQSTVYTHVNGQPAWVKSDGTPVAVLPKMVSPTKPEGAFVFPELNQAMGRAAVGALVGGAVGGVADGQEGFIYGSMVGALALGAGPTVAKKVASLFANMQIPASSKVGWDTRFKDAAGRGFEPNPTATQRFARWLEDNIQYKLPQELRSAMQVAKGAASWMLDAADSALQKIGWKYDAPKALRDLTNDFLDQTIDEVTYLARVANQFVNQSDLDYAQFAVTARNSITGLQKLAASGASPAQQKVINTTLDKYMTKSYKLFTHQNWVPDEKVIDDLAVKILQSGAWPNSTFESIRTELAQYVREVKSNSAIYKSPALTTKIGQLIAQKAFINRKQLSNTYKKFLGEVTDPTERIYQTLLRLRPMAEASKYFEQLTTQTKQDGWLPHFFQSRAEKLAFEQHLQSRVNLSADDAAKWELYQQVWRGHQNAQSHPRMGKLADGIVTRQVWDTLQTFDSARNEVANPLMRSLMGIHTAVKMGRTVFNPIQHVRNWLTLPQFAIIARADMNSMHEAWKILRDPKHPLREEVVSRGIHNVDQVRSEFYNELQNVLGDKFNWSSIGNINTGMGTIDLEIAEKLTRRGMRKVMDAFRVPDGLVRIGAYLSAKSRFAESMGKPLNDPSVIEAATQFTNRYTYNYDAIIPLGKKLREKPFANLFISYVMETARITKNLIEDVIKGSNGISHSRGYALLPLGMLFAIPAIIQSQAESALSPSDHADWQKLKGMMPEYMKYKSYTNIQRDKLGQFSFTDFTPLMPTGSFNEMFKAILDGSIEGVAEVNPVFGLDNTPMFNIVASQITGEDRRTEREFRGEPLSLTNFKDRIANIAKELLPPQMPGIGSEALKFVQAYTENEQGVEGITNLKTGVKLTPEDFWQPYYAGVRSSSANIGAFQRRLIAKAKNEIANETAYLNDILRTDMKPEVKQQAIDNTLRAIKAIQDTVRVHLQTPPDRN